VKTPQDHYIQVGKIETRFWVEGSQGPQVLMIHGLGGYVENWELNIAAIAEYYRVYALDLPGHGLTDKPLDISYKIEDLSIFVRDFMATVHIENADIIGHSLGGAVATRLAIRFSNVVKKIVLVGSAGLGRESSYLFSIMNVPILGELITRPSLEGSANSAKFLVYDPTIMTPESAELNYQIMSQPDAHQCFLMTVRENSNLFGQDKSMYGPNVTGLGTLNKPVLVIWGQEDQLVPVAHAKLAAQALPNARVQIFEKCGHLPMVEHPQVFNELVISFLSN